MTLTERLTRAWRRLAHGQAWNPRAFDACDKTGRWCFADDEAAHAFSILGALDADGRDGQVADAVRLLDGIAPSGSVIAWELADGRTPADVDKLFTLAVARAAALERRRG
jgi:hypothetical protein